MERQYRGNRFGRPWYTKNTAYIHDERYCGSKYLAIFENDHEKFYSIALVLFEKLVQLITFRPDVIDSLNADLLNFVDYSASFPTKELPVCKIDSELL